MALTPEQGKEYVATITAMTSLLDQARGNPDIWLQRRAEYLSLVARLDELTGEIEPWPE